ncbi:ArsC family reductase [Parathalassolituus penaei]|uniref:ArsC family reductase n=1 Tax=Parathalassolituus penaei TaxID=2997323 RepID=A0A9X3EC42_9GAMM|nr:ArsC family reductase [Parathalassolituus penaei]MCY0964129.1 ArsC family reductase [Parathalassolituus penaei]
MITLYGIKNCDTMKKARAWLDEADVAYQFHDYKKDGLSPELLDLWLQNPGWEALLNRRGTTWRKVPEDVRDNINEASARQLMLDNPSIIKRPLLDLGERKVLGFNADEYSSLFR